MSGAEARGVRGPGAGLSPWADVAGRPRAALAEFPATCRELTGTQLDLGQRRGGGGRAVRAGLGGRGQVLGSQGTRVRGIDLERGEGEAQREAFYRCAVRSGHDTSLCDEAEDEPLFISLEIEVGPICQDWAWEGFRIVIAVTLSFGVVLWEERLKLFPC